MFALKSGVLIPPSATKSLYDPQSYVGSQSSVARATHRGLFNPHVLFAAPVTTMDPHNNDPFTITNFMPNDAYEFPYFNPPQRSNPRFFEEQNL